MEILVVSAVSYGEFLAVTNNVDLGSVWQELLIALGICIINSVLLPLVKLVFSKVKDCVKKHQKTLENDGEIADKILDVLDDLQEKTEETIKDLTNKGVKNGKGKDDRQK